MQRREGAEFYCLSSATLRLCAKFSELVLLAVGGKGDDDGSALARHGHRIDAAAVFLHVFSRDREAEPRAARFRGKIRLKHAGEGRRVARRVPVS